MTGEIDLNGKIHQIGGLETKMWGAKQADVKLALFPSDNKHCLDQILKNEETPFGEDFKYKMVNNIKDAIVLLMPDIPGGCLR
jgi:ATP-dependent Lon protease